MRKRFGYDRKTKRGNLFRDTAVDDPRSAKRGGRWGKSTASDDGKVYYYLTRSECEKLTKAANGAILRIEKRIKDAASKTKRPSPMAAGKYAGTMPSV